MRITTTSRYGVRALFDVAYHGGGQPTQIKDIARRQKISQRYLEQIFNKLLKAGLLKSRRGPRGGYMLAKDKPVYMRVAGWAMIVNGVSCMGGFILGITVLNNMDLVGISSVLGGILYLISLICLCKLYFDG